MNTALELVVTGAFYLFAYFVGYYVGKRRGKDEQRVDDIMEQWLKNDRRRDPATGRFRTTKGGAK